MRTRSGVESGTIVMRSKKLIDADQAWFWTEVWQRGEREAGEDIARGRTRRSDSGDAFLELLGRTRGVREGRSIS